MTPHVPFSVPSPPTIVMSGRPNPARVAPSGWLMNTNAPAAPYPTAGSVMGLTIGRNPYFSSRKPPTSSHPSSAERNLDCAGVVPGSGVMVIWAPAAGAHTTTAVMIAIARIVRIRLRAKGRRGL
jgi:hypothetical protein